MESREARLSAAFVKLAGRLTDEFDVIDLLQTLAEECADTLDTQAAGIMLVDGDGQLQLIVSTSEETDLVEVMALNAGEGPCVDCFRSSAPITVGDIEDGRDRWPAFSREALRNGFRSVHATPLRLRGQAIGALNLFSVHVGALGDADVAVAQALADVSTIGLIQEDRAADATLVPRQLARAFDARILVEQAKGVIAEGEGVPISEAFALLRQHAQANDMTLRAAAVAATSGQDIDWRQGASK